MAEGGSPARDLAWLLDDLADRLKDFRRAVILSRDGLLIAASRDLSRENAEHLSAVASAVQSLAAGTGDRFAVGGVRQTQAVGSAASGGVCRLNRWCPGIAHGDGRDEARASGR